MLYWLLFYINILNVSFSDGYLSIQTDSSLLNSNKDSFLYLDVSFKNINEKKFIIRRLKSDPKGKICATYEWSLFIYHKDDNDQCIPPLSFCNEKEKPYIVLRKNAEYHSVLVINFKHIYKVNSYYYPIPNHDFGEYEIQLVLKMKGRDSINSNKIKIFYTDQ